MNGRRARQFGHLRSVLHSPPSAHGWSVVCKTLSRWSADEVMEISEYLAAQLSHWPDALRVPLYGVHPASPAFRLVRVVKEQGDMFEMCQHPEHVNVTQLNFTRPTYSSQLWDQLRAQPWLDAVTHLRADNYDCMRSILTLLCDDSLTWSSLRVLELMPVRGLEALLIAVLNAPWMVDVDVLRLDGGAFDASLWQSVDLTTPHHLKSLGMKSYTLLSDFSINQLLRSPRLRELVELDINAGLDGSLADAMSSFDRRWTSLGLTRLRPDLASLFGHHDMFRDLRALNMIWMDDELFDHIHAAPSLESLTVRDGHIRTPTSSKRWRAPLKTLALHHVHILDDFFDHVARAGWFDQIVEWRIVQIFSLNAASFLEHLSDADVQLRALEMVQWGWAEADILNLLSLPQLDALERLMISDSCVTDALCQRLCENNVIPRTCKVRVKGNATSTSIQSVHDVFNRTH